MLNILNNLALIKHLFFLSQFLTELLLVLDKNYTKFYFNRHYEKS